MTLLKAGAFAAAMFFAGARLLSAVMEWIAHKHSRELFVLAVIALTLTSALVASELFGVSLALGAFVAGAIISRSRLSRQVGADLFTFREIFSVLFFVSVGMLVDPLFLWRNLGPVTALTLLVVVGKAVLVLPVGLLLPGPARTFLIIALGMRPDRRVHLYPGAKCGAAGPAGRRSVCADPGCRLALDHAQPLPVQAAAGAGNDAAACAVLLAPP